MKRYCSILLGLCALIVTPGQAAAQDGSGLYEPSPEPASKERSSEFVTSLLAAQARREGKRARSVTEDQLAEGLVVAGGPAPPASDSGPSTRAASPGGFGPSFGWPAGILLGLAAISIPPLLLRRT